jgi:hypothetical protein
VEGIAEQVAQAALLSFFPSADNSPRQVLIIVRNFGLGFENRHERPSLIKMP